MQRHPFIVVDGADGAGKTVQTELLVKWLREEGRKVTVFDFPRYEESVYGALVRKCLSGYFGDFVAMSPYIASLPFALDRASAKGALLSALSEGIVVANRYTSSNIAYQAAKLLEGMQDEFTDFVECGEYGELGLPRPTVVIYLAVPVDVSRKLIEEERKKAPHRRELRDPHEEDLQYQAKVQGVYERFSRIRENWVTITCTVDDTLLSPPEIHHKVKEVVKNFVPL